MLTLPLLKALVISKILCHSVAIVRYFGLTETTITELQYVTGFVKRAYTNFSTLRICNSGV